MMTFKNLILLCLVGSFFNILKAEEIKMRVEWEKLFQYWIAQKVEYWHHDKKIQFTAKTKCKGATKLEIKDLERHFSDIPASLLESLSTCNESNRWFGFNGWGLLYGSHEIIETSKSLDGSCTKQKGIYKIVDHRITNPSCLFPKEWIPIFDWNGDYFVVIDMLSKPQGQIILISFEESKIVKWADSYEEWFEMAVDEVIKYGELRVETIEEVLAKALK